MNAVQTDIPFIFFAVKAVFAMATFIGLPLLLGLLIFGVVKNRPGVAAFSGTLLFLGLIFGSGLLYFFRAMPLSAPQAARDATWEVSKFDLPRHDFQQATHVSGRLSFLSMALIGAAVVAGLMTLFRGSSGKTAGCGGGRWWPAFLLVPLLAFVFLRGAVHVKRSESFSSRQEPARINFKLDGHVAHQQAELARQQAELMRRAKKLDQELHQRIAMMDIHELMDMVDAPRILLPVPAPATIMTLARTLAPPSEAPASPQNAPAPIPPAAAAADPLASAVVNDAQALNEQDAQLLAEANAAVESIAGKTESAGAADVSADNESARVVMVAKTAAAGEKSVADSDQGSAADRSNSTDHGTSPVRPLAKKDSDEKKNGADRVAEELSAPIESPSSEARIARQRPDWVSHPPKRIGNVQREVLVTDEWSSDEECERQRDVLLMRATYLHVQMLTGISRDDLQPGNKWTAEDPWTINRIRELNRAGINVDYVRREIAKDEYLETADRSVGPMMKLYTLVEFSPSVDRELRSRWEALERERRFWMLGGGAGSVLGLLGSVYGLLKIDTWTKGYYTKRLFLGVPAAIIGLLGLLALFGV